MSNFPQIRPVGDELFHADGQTNMTKLIVAFRNFVKAPKNGYMDELVIVERKQILHGAGHTVRYSRHVSYSFT